MRRYILDGYNLLFFAQETGGSFPSQRSKLILFLQKAFIQVHWEGLLVFDGSHRVEEESGRTYQSPLEIVYSHRGQTADTYITEAVAFHKNPKECTVVTNDRGLARAIQFLHGSVISNQTFLKRLTQKMQPRAAEKKTKDSPKQMERLLKEFEKRLEDLL